MADRTTSSVTIRADKATIMAVIADFPAYPEWAGQIKKVEVLEVGEDAKPAKVRFVVDAGVISDDYVLAYDWAGDSVVSWEIADAGRMVSGLTGSYRLEDAADGTDVTYELAVDLKVPMIGMIKRKGEKILIDTALNGLKRRVEGR
ncbi:cyclase [Planotetraspora thailandica]|uniref:Cyclase n=1 Tax=Planotetraspora thailandica TaxID=487172 RepID=A0A8J3VBD4_9ACTN|nr:SRPBCC family protein [Planotetraspora thailandica]GII53820.1 cyclase [Planotetraspora thailandica]